MVRPKISGWGIGARLEFHRAPDHMSLIILKYDTFFIMTAHQALSTRRQFVELTRRTAQFAKTCSTKRGMLFTRLKLKKSKSEVLSLGQVPGLGGVSFAYRLATSARFAHLRT